MKTIIIYYSYSGNNKLLAEALQARLKSDIQRVVELKRRTVLTMIMDVIFKKEVKVRRSKVLLTYYDLVILIGPIWWGKIASPLREFIKKEKRNINSYAFISVCGVGGNKGVDQELVDLLQKKSLVASEFLATDLLSKNQRFRFTSGYQLQNQDLQSFEPRIQRFLDGILQAFK